MRKSLKIKQRDITDCGPACLASIGSFYNLYIPVSRIRQYVGTDQKGTNVLGLIKGAEQLGFQAKGVKGSLDSLSKIPLPAIAHLERSNGLHHYVVIYSIKNQNILLMDPGDGQVHKKKIADFKSEWKGVLVLLLPGEKFESRSEKTSNVLRFWQLLTPHRGILFQAFVGAAVYTVLGLSMSIYLQKIVDFVFVEGNLRLLNLLSIGMIGILIFQSIINYYKSIMGLRTGQLIDARLILGYYKHLLQLPQRFFDTMRVGEIISRVNDAVKIRVFINDVAMNLVVNVLIVFFSLSIMFLYYWKLALIMVSVLPFYALLYYVSNRVNKRNMRTLMENGAALETQLVESVNAAGTIKRFGLEDFAGSQTESRFIRLLRTVYFSSVAGLRLSVVSDFVTKISTILILWAGGYFVVQHELSPGEILSFYALSGYFTGPALAILGSNKSIQDALIAADRLFEIIDLEIEEIKVGQVEITSAMIGEIVFDNVHFTYGTRTEVFKGLSFSIMRGKYIGVVGESGSGKSTLLSLLQNLYPLNQGNITIGGLNIKYISKGSLRKVIAVVPQEINLFAGTIIENISIGDSEPNVKKVLELCRLLGINEFVEKLSETYYSMVSEQGSNFSGGQKQRLAIARALYRDPEILIMDEATSSLDPLNEKRVQETLEWFFARGKTIIMIAHRLSTLSNCDEILFLKDGRLIDRGHHYTLLTTSNEYAELWNK